MGRAAGPRLSNHERDRGGEAAIAQSRGAVLYRVRGPRPGPVRYSCVGGATARAVPSERAERARHHRLTGTRWTQDAGSLYTQKYMYINHGRRSA